MRLFTHMLATKDTMVKLISINVSANTKCLRTFADNYVCFLGIRQGGEAMKSNFNLGVTRKRENGAFLGNMTFCTQFFCVTDK